MNRKEFISRLGMVSAAAVAAPLLGDSNLYASAASLTNKKIKKSSFKWPVV